MSDRRSPLDHAEPLSRSARLPRQPYLTEDEFRAINSESRRRVMEHLDMEQDTNTPSVYSYSNRVPARQSLYDWAAVADEDDDDPTHSQRAFFARRFAPGNNFHSVLNTTSTTSEDRERLVDERRRREREMRRNLEPRDEPSGRVRPPPGRNRSPSEEEREEHIARLTASGRSPSVTAALSRLIERQRVERRERRWEREHAVEATRAEDQNTRSTTWARSLRELRSRERFQQFMDSRHKLKPPTMPKTVSMIKYLSELRECTKVSDALALASAHDITTLYSSKTSNSPSDLPLSTTEFTPAQHSSFLTPGAVFEGVQQSASDPPVTFLNRDRDYLRRMVANRNLNFSSTNLPGSLTALMDAERYILDFIDDENVDSSSNSSARTAIPPQPRQDPTSSSWSARPRNRQSRSTPLPTNTSSAPDSWPVRVTLHTVSLPMCTLSGTMSASHIPDKLSPDSTEYKPEGSSMESYFVGEIIDFHRFSLETGSDGFKSGGAEVDARHWRGVGPLREVAQAVRKRKVESAHARGRGTGTTENQRNAKDGLTHEEEEELEGETDEELQRCLGSKDWLEHKLGSEAEWILMRWKERCFLSLPPSTSVSDRYGNPLPGRSPNNNNDSQTSSISNTGPPSSSSTTTAVISSNSTSIYGLTISGYYYIALHRMTGRIEGLYFDPGSQPYQELKLVPQGMAGPVTFEKPVGSGPDDEKGTDVDDDLADHCGEKRMDTDGDGDIDRTPPADQDSRTRHGQEVGLKKWFPSVEFR